ncbi:MAG: hypothetical protein FJY91_00185 [Candidatus Harrisonbacteria bacterium]|nr:hypothetical protein [Candidatus Harrisonbacteria bacterium]
MNLALAFLSLPEPVKDWFGSLELADRLSDVNNSLGLVGDNESLLSNLLLRIITLDLDIRDLINELGLLLQINEGKAKEIAATLIKTTLTPIEKELIPLGINVRDGLANPSLPDSRLSTFGNTPRPITPEINPLATPLSPKSEAFFKNIPLPQSPPSFKEGDSPSKAFSKTPITLPPIFEFSENRQEEKKEKNFTPPENLPLVHQKEASPFILHEEKAEQTINISQTPSFTYTPSITEIPKKEEVIVSSIEGLAPVIPPTAQKVIHYTSYKTELNHAFSSIPSAKKDLESKIKKPLSHWFI